MIPPWIWFVKNMLNSTISMSYPDVVIACIEIYACLWKHSRAIEAALVKHDNNTAIISGGWLITITANHSNYLVCDRANTQSVTVRKVVKLQLNYCNALVIKQNLHHRPVRREERGMLFFITFKLMYMLSFLTLVSDGRLQWPSREIPGPFLLKSDVNLFNHLVRKADVLRVVVLYGFCSSPIQLLRIQCRWFVLFSCFYVKLMQIN